MPEPVIQENPVRVIKTEGGVEVPLFLVTTKRKVEGVETETTFAATRFPEQKQEALNKAIEIWGVDQIFDVFQTDYLRRAKKWSADATDDKTGKIDFSDVERMTLDYSSRSESIPELKLRIQELATVELRDVFLRPDLSPAQKGEEAQKISERIRKLNEDIKGKRRKTPEDEKALAEESGDNA